MKYKAIAAILAMLGFGTSCSTVKHPKSEQKPDKPAEVLTDTVEIQQIRLMYGVPRAEFRQPEVMQEQPAESGAPAEEKASE